MSTIIPLPAREAHLDRDAAARNRMDRLNRATTQEMHAALAFLNMIDADAFEIAFQAVPPNRDDLPDADPEPLCGRCGHPVALFPDQGMTWHHYRARPTPPVITRPSTRATSPGSSGTSPMRSRRTSDLQPFQTSTLPGRRQGTGVCPSTRITLETFPAWMRAYLLTLTDARRNALDREHLRSPSPRRRG
jgi:hypothetical protein